LLIETKQGIVIVDTGLGLHDFYNPGRMVRFFQWDFGIHNQPDSAAVRQIVHLGYAPEEVRHIVMTHLHFDHAGGLQDYPHDQVHVHRREVEAVLHPRSWIELAYDQADFAHQLAWALYDQPDADWLGLEAIRLPFSVEMYLIPLFGHTRGHCGVAIQSQAGWFFQCGDAIPVNAQFDITPGWLNRLVLGPHVPRLQAWAKAHPDVQLLAGHMW
jgi:glyoxylase-like metal-dependent hydrolase (beta-lactamase superfamily II)